MEYNNNYNQNPQNNVVYQTPANMPMAFHNFYKWLLVVLGALSLIPFITSLGSDYATILSSTLVSAGLNIVTGICLMKMNKAGKALQSIVNIFNIISGALEIGAGLLVMLFGNLIGSAIGDSVGSLTTGIFAIFGVIFLVIGIVTIIINACILKYYKKRKHLFV